MSRAKPSDPSSWPTVWRLACVPVGAAPFVIEEVASERGARLRAVELRRLGWPVRIERVSLQPLPARAFRRMNRIEERREAESATRH